jgi:hypothetical protein
VPTAFTSSQSTTQPVGSPVQKYSKFIVAIAAVLGDVINEGLVSGTAGHVVSIVIAALGAIGVYLVPNTATSSAIGAHSASNVSTPSTPSI